MSIVKRSVAEPALAAQAGAIIGAAEERKRTQEIALRQAEQAANRQFQLAAQERAQQWELQKMELRSQQDFQQELRMRQAELDREARAKEWELEKMEIRSRMDFEREERKRAERLAAFDAAKQTVQRQVKLGILTPEMGEKLTLKAYLDTLDIEASFPMEEPLTLSRERRELESAVGPGIGKFLDIETLRETAGKSGYTRIPTDIRPQPASPEEGGRFRGKGYTGSWGQPASPEVVGMPKVTNQAEFDVLPSGTLFLDAEGNVRRKP